MTIISYKPAETQYHNQNPWLRHIGNDAEQNEDDEVCGEEIGGGDQQDSIE